MSSFYKKAKAGRKTAIESASETDVIRIATTNNLDLESMEVCKTPEELYALREKLISEYGLPTVEKTDVSETIVKKSQPRTPNVSTKEEETETFELDEEDDFDDAPESRSFNSAGSSKETFQLSDFEETTPTHAFESSFKKEDLFKGTQFVETIEEETIEESVPNAWELAKDDISHQVPDDNNEVESSSSSAPLSEDEKTKVKLAKSTSKKATESLARQTAKIFEFTTDWGAKRYSKISDSYLDKQEEKGLIDRNFMIDGVTITDLIDQHNELIDELLATDPEMHEELIEALMLVAEKHQIEMSPEANLGMVIVTMLISKFKAGHDQKKLMQKTLKKASDQYSISTRALFEANKRNADLQNQMDELRALKMTPSVQSVATPDQPQTETGIKNLVFGIPEKKPTIQIPSEPREFSEASAMLEEVNSTIAGDQKPTKAK